MFNDSSLQLQLFQKEVRASVECESRSKIGQQKRSYDLAVAE